MKPLHLSINMVLDSFVFVLSAVLFGDLHVIPYDSYVGKILKDSLIIGPFGMVRPLFEGRELVKIWSLTQRNTVQGSYNFCEDRITRSWVEVYNLQTEKQTAFGLEVDDRLKWQIILISNLYDHFAARMQTLNWKFTIMDWKYTIKSYFGYPGQSAFWGKNVCWAVNFEPRSQIFSHNRKLFQDRIPYKII